MKVTMDMQEYEALRDTQIPYKVEETDTQKIVRVSKNVIEQTLAEQLDIECMARDSGTGYMTTKKAKEFIVVFDD